MPKVKMAKIYFSIIGTLSIQCRKTMIQPHGSPIIVPVKLSEAVIE
jgi:hypothetical protein